MHCTEQLESRSLFSGNALTVAPDADVKIGDNGYYPLIVIPDLTNHPLFNPGQVIEDGYARGLSSREVSDLLISEGDAYFEKWYGDNTDVEPLEFSGNNAETSDVVDPNADVKIGDNGYYPLIVVPDLTNHPLFNPGQVIEDGYARGLSSREVSDLLISEGDAYFEKWYGDTSDDVLA